MSILGRETQWEQHYTENPYMKLFLSDISLRPSCYQCHSKGFGRHSDLTLGDFWGAENVALDMDDDRGLSLVLIQTPKGKRLIEKADGRMYRKKVNLETAVQNNPSLLRASACPSKKRALLFYACQTKALSEEEFAQLVEKLLKKSFWRKGKELIWKLLYESGGRK